MKIKALEGRNRVYAMGREQRERDELAHPLSTHFICPRVIKRGM